MYAVPRPSLPARCITWMRGLGARPARRAARRCRRASCRRRTAGRAGQRREQALGDRRARCRARCTSGTTISAPAAMRGARTDTALCLPRCGPRRAWIYVLSVAGAARAGGRDRVPRRGVVSRRARRGRRAARAPAPGGARDRGAHRRGDRRRRSTRSTAIARGAAGAPLARYWFWIDADGTLARAARRSPSRARARPRDRAATRAPVDSRTALRELRDAPDARRQAARRAARRGVLRRGRAAATRAAAYAALATSDDTGPDALLGLARAVAALGDDAARGRARRARSAVRGDRDLDGAAGAARDRARCARRPRRRAARRSPTPCSPATTSVDPVVGSASRRACATSSPASCRPRARRRRRARRTRSRRSAARRAPPPGSRRRRRASCATRDDRRGAAAPPSREPGAHADLPARAPTAASIGIAVDAPMLEAAAGRDRRRRRARTRARSCCRPARAAPAELRALAQVPLGEALPHLALALVNPVERSGSARRGDPRALAAPRRCTRRRSRSRSALGLLATIRGAARARELAQLKSDFVSTVSHELKTPLTSIRMFAEMLEQGVAQGDAAKMAPLPRRDRPGEPAARPA